HPANKTLLADRLARAPLREAWPIPARAVLAGETITFTFSVIEDGLHAWSAAYPIGLETCRDTQESCRYVRAAIDGDRLLIPATDRQRVSRIRCAWADRPVVNFFDGRTMPIPGFELPVER